MLKRLSGSAEDEWGWGLTPEEWISVTSDQVRNNRSLNQVTGSRRQKENKDNFQMTELTGDLVTDWIAEAKEKRERLPSSFLI